MAIEPEEVDEEPARTAGKPWIGEHLEEAFLPGECGRPPTARRVERPRPDPPIVLADAAWRLLRQLRGR